MRTIWKRFGSVQNAIHIGTTGIALIAASLCNIYTGHIEATLDIAGLDIAVAVVVLKLQALDAKYANTYGI